MLQERRRSRLMLGLVALGLLAGAALTAHPAQAVDAVGPYYAKPAWDQKLPVATRFVVLTNWASAAVLDKDTGLVWEKSPDVTLATWSAARIACKARHIGNRKGWRLPSVHELASLMDTTHQNPALPAGHPFLNIPVNNVFYWSATTNPEGDASNAWLVNFYDGGVGFIGKTIGYHVWCVRGGMNADQY